MMKRLRQRIERMLRQGSITDPQESDKLEYLLRTKKWNPYCIRHSAEQSVGNNSFALAEFGGDMVDTWYMQ
jgi:hypothetical protein